MKAYILFFIYMGKHILSRWCDRQAPPLDSVPGHRRILRLPETRRRHRMRSATLTTGRVASSHEVNIETAGGVNR